jgi:hypothetical protein
MVANLGKVTTVAGAIAYQDTENKNLFWYYPLSVDLVPGETLLDFKVTYWGIGKPFYVQIGNRINSTVGAILAGRAEFNITSKQRGELVEQIRKQFSIQTPQLQPINLSNVVVQPLVADKTLQLGNDADINFPSSLQIGSSFNYLIGTSQNSLFTQFVATQSIEAGIIADPSFAVNIQGEAEFQGDPWTAEIEADLSQVWTYVRKRTSASINLGWFNFKLGDYESIVEELKRESIIKINLIEGSVDNEVYGRQIFQMAREIFEEVNKRTNSQSGFFRFEPNREPPTSGQSSNFSFGWTFSVNLSFSETAITSSQSMHYNNTISYTGRLKVVLPASMTLAVSCNSASASMFQDLGNVNEPCITQSKVDQMQDRLGEEFKRQSSLLQDLELRFITGQITEEQYQRAVDLITNGTLAPSFIVVPAEYTLLATGTTVKAFAPAQERSLYSVNEPNLEEIIAEAIRQLEQKQ